MPDYHVAVADLSSVESMEVPASNLQYGYALNSPGACTFALPLRHDKTDQSLIYPGKNEIIVYRDNVKVWAGYLWTADADIAGGLVNFSAEGYLSRMRRRRVISDLSYVNVDQTQVAWNLINHTQTQTDGDLGFTDHHTNSTVLVSQKYKGTERVVILDAIQELAQAGSGSGSTLGFDFDIGTDKHFNTYYPSKGTYKPDIFFSTGKNVQSGSHFVIDATNAGNIIYTKNSRGTTLKTSTDTTLRGTYKRMEDVVTADLRDATALQAFGDERLRAQKNPLITPSVSISLRTTDADLTTFSVGDFVTLFLDAGYAAWSPTYTAGVITGGAVRVQAITVSVDNEGNEIAAVTLDDPTGLKSFDGHTF